VIRVRRLAAAAAAALLLAVPGPSVGHAQAPDRGRTDVFAGSVFESYLRYLQTLDRAAGYPVSIRSYAPSEIDVLGTRDTAHAWSSRYSLEARPAQQRGWTILGSTLAADVNTAFPFGGNDGPVWRGKGLTLAALTGVAIRYGALSAVVAPVFFRSQNLGFPLSASGLAGAQTFADGVFPLNIDRPQRFGDDAYTRLDPGESTIRVEAAGLTAAVSTASQWWGPSTEFAPILGNNAGGFPHLYLGTSRPANFGLGRFHARVVYGYLEQSAYSPVTGSRDFEDFENTGTRRFMAGLVAVATIRGAPGLEIGGSRFFHSASASGGLTKQNFALPFQGLLKRGLPVSRDTSSSVDRQAVRENQLASVFFRWAPPGSGFDAYAEFAREDHSADMRDFFLQPDHSVMTNVGVRGAWLNGRVLNAVRAEVFSYDPQGGLQAPGAGRSEGGVYIHSILRQGHTHRGQLLGADVGPGSGNAQVIAYERFSPRGRSMFFLRRAVARESSIHYSPDIEPIDRALDVLFTVGAELTWFIGDLDLTARAAATREYNRYLVDDRSNATLGLTLRYLF
jgi:hypothetical protein